VGCNPSKNLRLACGQGELGVTDAVGFCYAVLEPSRDVRPVSTSDTHTFAAFGIRSLVRIYQSHLRFRLRSLAQPTEIV
jgi:hypothetical protein